MVVTNTGVPQMLSLCQYIYVHKSSDHKSLNQNSSLPDLRKAVSRVIGHQLGVINLMIKQTLVVHAVTELIFRSKQPRNGLI